MGVSRQYYPEFKFDDLWIFDSKRIRGEVAYSIDCFVGMGKVNRFQKEIQDAIKQ